MRRHIYSFLTVTLMGATALAAAPDLLPPLGMLVDTGDSISATGLDFLSHPQSGSENFNPNNYNVKVGNVTLSTDDVVAYNGVLKPLKDCQEVAKTMADVLANYFGFMATQLLPKLGVAPEPIDPLDMQKFKDVIQLACTAMPPDKQKTYIAGKSLAHLVLADIRNATQGSADVVFSGKSEDPYTAGLPLAAGRVGAPVSFGVGEGTDGVIIAAPESFIKGDVGIGNAGKTSLLSASLSLFRFTANAAPKKILQFNSFSSAWLDRPLADAAGKVTNNCLQKTNDPKKPVVPKSDAELLKEGCVGEGDVIGIATPHLYVNSNDALEKQGKSRDLVVVSRSPMGDPKDPASKIGYLTVYRRTSLVPDDKAIFQDIWQFDKSVTAANGIKEPYGIAVLKGTPTDSVVVTSATAIENPNTKELEFFIYRYDGKNGVVPIRVGCHVKDPTATCPLARRSAAPYKIVTADITGDSCDDILLTRAYIVSDPVAQKMEITFSRYFDLFPQGKAADGTCNGTFNDTKDVASIGQVIPQWDPAIAPKVSAVWPADYNGDGKIDVMAGDFSTYKDPVTGKRTSYAHFLENKGGLLNTMLGLPRYAVSTIEHSSDVGVIDSKADAFANYAAVIGPPMVFEPVKIPPLAVIVPNPCIPGGIGGAIPNFCNICSRDNDGDKFNDIPGNVKSVDVQTCEFDANGQGNIVTKQMVLDLTLFTYTPDCTKPNVTATKTGRQWMHLLAGCDNCNTPLGNFPGDNCANGPEAGAGPGFNKCWNKTQADKDEDGYGDICSPGPVFLPKPAAAAAAPAQAPAPAPAGPEEFKFEVPVNALPGNEFQANFPPADIYAASGVPPPPAGNDSIGGNSLKVTGRCVDGTVFDNSWLTFKNGKSIWVDNDLDKDSYPDCMVSFSLDDMAQKIGTINCNRNCDSCNPQGPMVKVGVLCIGPEGAGPNHRCYNPTQTNNATICPVPVPPQASLRRPLRGDRVIYADDQPVIAYQSELKLTAGPAVPDNGQEVTILLNKTTAKGTPPPCQNGDLACICQQNPDLQICKCQKDPNAPGCMTGPIPQVSCCLDVCRGDLTAPFPAMCDFIRPFNDQIRKSTGLCMDVLVPVEGTQYHLSCTMANAPVLDLGAGKAYAQVFKSAGGQIPRNYSKVADGLKPVASQNLLGNTVLLNSLDDAATGGKQFDVSVLPKPDFPFDASLSAVAPDVAVNQAPGITQIDGIMQIETYVTDLDPATGAPVTKQMVGPPGGAAPVTAKALLLDIKGYSSPPGCQWKGPECPEPMRNPPPPQAFVDAIQAKVTEYERDGKPITIDTINEAFKSMDVGPAFLHQEFVVAGSQGAMTVPMQNAMGGFAQEGGCGCSFAAASSVHNTLLPLLMSVVALGGMVVLRRKSAKKR